jgi:hypothetical protein
VRGFQSKGVSAATIGQPCDLFAGCVPKPPVLEDSYCCAETTPLIRKVGPKRWIVVGRQGWGCRAVAKSQGCMGLEERVVCDGYQTEILSGGYLECR